MAKKKKAQGKKNSINQGGITLSDLEMIEDKKIRNLRRQLDEKEREIDKLESHVKDVTFLAIIGTLLTFMVTATVASLIMR